jgi:hypothetical protein
MAVSAINLIAGMGTQKPETQTITPDVAVSAPSVEEV